jgi:hypothetical protein
LDDNKCIAAILMDLSKAFACLSRNLLMLKLEAYGLSENSSRLLKSYLENTRIYIVYYTNPWKTEENILKLVITTVNGIDY